MGVYPLAGMGRAGVVAGWQAGPHRRDPAVVVVVRADANDIVQRIAPFAAAGVDPKRIGKEVAEERALLHVSGGRGAGRVAVAPHLAVVVVRGAHEDARHHVPVVDAGPHAVADPTLASLVAGCIQPLGREAQPPRQFDRFAVGRDDHCVFGAQRTLDREGEGAQVEGDHFHHIRIVAQRNVGQRNCRHRGEQVAIRGFGRCGRVVGGQGRAGVALDELIAGELGALMAAGLAARIGLAAARKRFGHRGGDVARQETGVAVAALTDAGHAPGTFFVGLAGTGKRARRFRRVLPLAPDGQQDRHQQTPEPLHALHVHRL